MRRREGVERLKHRHHPRGELVDAPDLGYCRRCGLRRSLRPQKEVECGVEGGLAIRLPTPCRHEVGTRGHGVTTGGGENPPRALAPILPVIGRIGSAPPVEVLDLERDLAVPLVLGKTPILARNSKASRPMKSGRRSLADRPPRS